MRIIITRTGELLAANAVFAESFFQRLRGLMGREALAEGEALIIPKCSMVHMLFMRFPIDVVFLSREFQVRGLVSNLRPCRVSPLVVGSAYAVELTSGSIASSGIRIGDTVEYV